MKLFLSIIFAFFCCFSTMSFAADDAGWTVVSSQSRLGFGSVKKDTIGEVHHLNGLEGWMSSDGDLRLTIDLNAVETNIDIRNERMKEHVFGAGNSIAEISGKIDTDTLSGLDIGDIEVVDVEVQLSFLGKTIPIEAEMLVARLSERRVLVTSADFIMLSTEDLGIDAGIDKLQELATLPSITRNVPIAIRTVFEK